MLPPAVVQLLDIAIAEDLAYGDITSETLFPLGQIAKANVVVRQSAVVSGLTVAQTVFKRLDTSTQCQLHVSDGQAVTPGAVLMTVEGPVVAILKAERLVLNFLQHLSGVATLTYQFVGAVAGYPSKITHTRKTTPGLRELEIQAVIHGGGSPHRKSLSHAVMVKDNHIHAAGGIESAIRKLRSTVGHTVRIEVECDRLEQVDEALLGGADIILLDNMALETLTEAVKRCKGKAITEASGGVTLSTIMAIAKTGVDVISTSQITLGAPAVDVGLDFI